MRAGASTHVLLLLLGCEAAPVGESASALLASAELERHPRFLLVRDRALQTPTPPWTTPLAYTEALTFAEAAWAHDQPDGAKFLVVFTSFDPENEYLFYVGRANDVAGLGEGPNTRIFDETPGSSLEGVVFLGDFALLEAAGPSFFTEVFLQELAHRYGAYVRIAHPRLPSTALLGRDLAHWSYLADTGPNPLGGNAWHARPDGRVATAMTDELRFHPLDLYLMGVLPPEAVPPIRLYRPTAHEPAGYAISPASPSAHRSGIEVVLGDETSELVTIEQIVAGSGPRDPPAVDGTAVWRVGVVLLARGSAAPDLALRAALDRRLDQLGRAMGAATDGRVRLSFAVSGAGEGPLRGPCDTLERCDRSVADRCASPAPAAMGVCTRACETGSECGPGSCCRAAEEGGERLCWPLALCPAIPRRPDPAPVEPDAPPPGPPVPAPPAPPGGCRSGAPDGAILLLLVAFGLRRARASAVLRR